MLLLLSHFCFSSSFSVANMSSGLHYIAYITTAWTVVCLTSSDSLHMRLHLFFCFSFFWNTASVSLTALLRFFIGWETEKCVFRNTNVFVGRRFYNAVKQWLLWGINVCLCSSMASPRVWNKHAAGIPLISQRGRHICGLPFICWRGTKSTHPVWRHERLFLNQRVFITCF